MGVTGLRRMPDVRILGLIAGVAQLVEQRIRNAKVNSSIPFTGTKTTSPGQPRALLFLGSLQCINAYLDCQ
jgi:hypothetical protein